MGNVTKVDVYKRQAINLAEHHRKNCDGDCNISLWLLKEMAEECGVTFTDKEGELFL